MLPAEKIGIYNKNLKKYSKRNKKKTFNNKLEGYRNRTTAAYPSLGYQHTLNFLFPQNTWDESILCYY